MRRALPLLALLCALFLGACAGSTIDSPKLEREIEKGLKKQTNLKTVKVSCPEDVDAKKGGTFNCTAKAGGDSSKIKVTQRDDEGNVRWELSR